MYRCFNGGLDALLDKTGTSLKKDKIMLVNHEKTAESIWIKFDLEVAFTLDNI